MTAFILKIIAMAAMLADHIGQRLAGNPAWMRVVGRCAFILYAFLVAESWAHLRKKPERVRRHIVKLLLLCLVSEVPYDLFCGGGWIDRSGQNVVFTLLFGFLVLATCGWWRQRFADDQLLTVAGECVICLLAGAAAHLIRADYGGPGVLLIALFSLYLRRADEKSPARRLAELAGLYAVYILVYLWTKAGFGGFPEIAQAAEVYRWWMLGMLLPFLPIFLYNRKLGYHRRWFRALYSGFYPAHMLILFLIWRFIA